MAGERIAAAASYLVSNAAPHLADTIRRFEKEPRQNWEAILSAAFAAARESLDAQRVQAIMGPIDDTWMRESYVAAVKLCNEAIATAAQNQKLWDKRKTSRTRRSLLVRLADDHIRRWCADRGMDPAEAARLRDGGSDK